MTASSEERLKARSDLAWAIAVGGIGIALFVALLAFTWTFAAALFLIFAGILLGVTLNAMTNRLGMLVKLPHPLRLAAVCIILAALVAGVVYLGGATIADQAKALSNTIKSQLVNVKAFLDQHGIDTNYFGLGKLCGSCGVDDCPCPASGGAIVSQTLKLLLGTVSAVGNIFIVLFLGLAFAAQPAIYRDGLIFMVPAKYRGEATAIIDAMGETLERWLLAQIFVMFAVFATTWIGLAVIGIQSSFILGIQAGLLAFIPTLGAIIGGVIVVLASLASGWVAGFSAFILFLGVHAMESYIITPIVQRQAIDIPPATLFAFQILLGIVFGVWGLALALPLMAIVKVMIDYFKSDDAAAVSAG